MRKRIETPPEVALHADSQQKNPSIDGVDSVTKWQKAATGAIDTAKKATALAKAHLIRESRKHGGRWQWVDFPGPNRLLKYSPASKSILPRSIVRAGLFSYPGITAPDPAYSGLI